MKVLIDIASIAKRDLFAGEDKVNGTYVYDEVLGKEVLLNSAGYGYHNLCSSFASFMEATGAQPCQMILVSDGAGALNLRRSKAPFYKEGRHKTPGFYKVYEEMMAMFVADMLNLGAQTAVCPGFEADDLIAWLARTLKEDDVLVWSNDYDLLALSGGNVNVYSNGQLNPQPYGDFPYEFIDLYKATVGDPSDKIPGAKGFGPKAFEAVYQRFGDDGLRALRKGIREKRLAELESDGDVEKLPVLKKLVDYAPDVETSLFLATFQTQDIKFDKIVWRHGMNRAGASVHPLLQGYGQTVTGVTAGNFQTAFAELKQHLNDTDLVFFDIETATPEVSDHWLYNVKGKENSGVDVFGSFLVGFSLTVGRNAERTFYFSVRHADTDNISMAQAEEVLKLVNENQRFVIHNCNFELPVLHNAFGWFLRDVDDTKLMASYVDENESNGLKQNSLRWLQYEQTSYEDTVRDSDGRLRKMDELSLHEVLTYGADDTICTAALYHWFQLHMMLENVWQVYRDVEIGAVYWTAQAFIDGVDIDQTALARMINRDAADKLTYENILHNYLIEQGWEGSVFQEADADTLLTPAWVKYAFHTVSGEELETRVRKPESLIQAVRDQGQATLADVLETRDVGQANAFVRSHFSGKPLFNAGSPKQMQKLMYEVMGLPTRLRNKPTDRMRQAGVEGTPQTDDVAIQSALHYDLPESEDPRRTVLEALLKIKMYNTREGLYYKSYPKLPHWSDKKIHASMNQCATVTRRFTSSNPK